MKNDLLTRCNNTIFAVNHISSSSTEDTEGRRETLINKLLLARTSTFPLTFRRTVVSPFYTHACLSLSLSLSPSADKSRKINDVTLHASKGASNALESSRESVIYGIPFAHHVLRLQNARSKLVLLRMYRLNSLGTDFNGWKKRVGRREGCAIPFGRDLLAIASLLLDRFSPLPRIDVYYIAYNL